MSLSFNGYQTQSVRFQDDLEASAGDVLGATARQTMSELPATSLYRMAELGNAQLTGQRLDAATARQRIDDAGLKGRLTIADDGMTSEALDILIARKREEIKRQEVLNRAPGGFGMGAAQLGTAFAASMLDPINIGSAFVPVVGEARYLRYLANARGVLGRTAVRAGVGAVEGAAGAALVEPLVHLAKTQEQADYDFTDSLLNVGFGTVFGGGLHAVGGAALDAARYMRGESKYADDIVLPLTEIADFYKTRVKGTEVGDMVANPLFEIGHLDAAVASKMRDALPAMPNGDAVVRVSGRALKHIEEQRPKVASEIVDRIEDIVLKPDEVFPHPTNDSRAFLVKRAEGLDNAVTVLEVARRQDGLDVVTIYTAPDRSLRKMRKQAGKETSGLEGQQPTARAADSPHPSSAPLGTPHAAADFLPVSPDLDTIPPPAGAVMARDIISDAPPQAREAAMRTAIGQAVSGKAVEVDPILKASDVRAAAERQTEPESDITADPRASTAADQQLADQSSVADPIAEREQAIAQHLAELKDAARIAGIELDDELAEFDELIAQAETYGKAARAAVLCGLGH